MSNMVSIGVMDIPAFIDRDKAMMNSHCRSCKQPIFWAVTLKGKPHPLNEDGSSHFGTCPEAKKWSKKEKS